MCHSTLYTRPDRQRDTRDLRSEDLTYEARLNPALLKFDRFAENRLATSPSRSAVYRCDTTRSIVIVVSA